MTGHILIVGASLGGLRAAEQLRSRGWQGRITVVGEEAYRPYNRPPLSKDVLGSDTQTDADDTHRGLAFRLRDSLSDVDWRLGRSVVSTALEDRQVRLDDGESLVFDGLVVATGLRSRRLPLEGGESGRHVIRDLDDALALRQALAARPRVAVVGFGFIGCEVAATARTLGCEVTVVGPEACPLERVLGGALGAAVQRYHEARGVAFRPGRTVRAMRPDSVNGPVQGLVLDDGEVLPAEVVVEAIGSHPNVEWLAGNGLDLGDGVLCDNALRVEGLPHVVAVGDVARFPNPLFDDVPRRVEHWCMPTDTAKRAARTLVDHLAGAPADESPFEPLPTFWTDQFDRRVQGLGAPALADRVVVAEGGLDLSRAGEDGLAVEYYRDDRLVGAALVQCKHRLAYYRKRLQSAGPPIEARRSAGTAG
ncbi:NAD(P)/FAD-dependent oxidoreductase [Arhodomonas sp. AD133]|uniref:NAD(P)/FAD-dependent oxidoreductase n=1 Tax=Arhodomonas sp. AD133 TaxID=3415009 RepID=UPI003EC00E0A